ncbi:MAG: hypothetical protein GY822_02030 [Deltaproteobacteria bacterium]|nr:hypothetical protein [Deltaproteobacteria bacterium]
MMRHSFQPNLLRATKSLPLASSLLFYCLAVMACNSGMVETDPLEPAPAPDVEPAVSPNVDVLALAGPDLEVLEGTRAVLHGESSRSLTGAFTFSWTQLEGPAVLLTNASSAAPAFIAPLSPAVLRFRLTVSGAFGAEHDDDVLVRVTEQDPQPPFFVRISGDIASQDESAEVSLSVLGASPGDVIYEANALCGINGSVSIEGSRVLIERVGTEPCPVVVDARDQDGRHGARAAFVFWYDAQLLPGTQLRSNAIIVDPEGVLTFDTIPTLGVEEELLLWPAEGRTLLAGERSGSFVAPKERTVLRFAGERRRGAYSGGVSYLDVQVSDLRNSAPTANGGPDRIVFPGAFFALDTRQSMDADGDDLELDVLQVLGPNALLVDGTPGTFQAPMETGIALFHVRAFDGRIFSEPDSVRVTIVEEGGGVPPVVDLERQQFVSPQKLFVLDGSGAVDPDSGFVERIIIQQEATDEVILLPEPVEASTVEILAGENGDLYHFRISAFDQEGLSGFADIEVHVEEAGPFVDPVRGSSSGNGTVASPFSSLEIAVEIARRHRFSTLFLAAGTHAPFGDELPRGLSLVGGLTYDDALGYQDEGGEAILPSTGFAVEDAELSRLTLRLTDQDGSLLLSGTSSLVDVQVVGADLHTGDLVRVESGAVATLERCVLTPRLMDTALGYAMDFVDAFVVRLIDVVVEGGAGDERGGVKCKGSALDIVGGRIVGGQGATTGVGLFTEQCDVQLLGAEIIGGVDVEESIGAEFHSSVVIADTSTHIVGLQSGEGTYALGVRATGDGFAGFISAEVRAADKFTALVEHAVAFELQAGRLQLSSANLQAEGLIDANAILFSGEALDVIGGLFSASSVDGEAVALWAKTETSLRLSDVELLADGKTAIGARGLDEESFGVAVSLELTDIVVTGIGEEKSQGLIFPSTVEAALSNVEVNATGAGADAQAQGFFLQHARLDDVRVVVTGAGAVSCAHLLGELEPQVVHRFSCNANSTAASAVGLQTDHDAILTSSAVVVVGAVSTVGVLAAGTVTGLHVSVSSSDIAWHSQPEATIILANSLLHGVTALKSEAENHQWTGLALSGTTLLSTLDSEVTDESGLVQVGCQACRQVVLVDVVDPLTLHLSDGDNVLVDAAALGFLRPDDIDGESRPDAADIGCDERVP